MECMKALQLRIDEALYDAIEALAKREHRSLNQQGVVMLELALATNQSHAQSHTPTAI